MIDSNACDQWIGLSDWLAGSIKVSLNAASHSCSFEVQRNDLKAGNCILKLFELYSTLPLL